MSAKSAREEPSAQADRPSPAQRPMNEKYKSRKFSANKTASIAQQDSYHSSKNKLPMSYVQMGNASYNSTMSEYNEPEDELSSILLEGLKKPHLCDVAMIGKDGVTIGAPKFPLVQS